MSGIPQVWVVGVDGKIIYAGRPSGQFKSIVEAEMAKVQYPGLGIAGLDKDLGKAGKAWSKGEFADARTEAQEVLEDLGEADDRESETIRAQAQHIIDRVTANLAAAVAAANEAYDAGDYLKAFRAYEAIAEHYEDTPEAEEAEDKAKAMKKDRDIKDVMSAQEKVEAVWAAMNPKNAQSVQGTLAAMQQLAEKYEGTIAGEQAAEYAKLLGG